jgi:hypothetical protein
MGNTNKYTSYAEKEEVMRDDWDARLENAQHRAFKRR